MNLGVKTVIKGIFSLNITQIQYVPIRHRYYAEKIAKGPIAKKFGYVEKVKRRGLLPRLKDAKAMPGPLYSPVSPWSPRKCTFGQNDYIDILGDGKIKPYEVCYNVPRWLRGQSGNEMKLLILKSRVFSKTKVEYEHPKAWNNLHKRIKYLYSFMNRKTKTSFMKD